MSYCEAQPGPSPHPPASVPQVLGLQAYTTTPGFCRLYSQFALSAYLGITTLVSCIRSTMCLLPFPRRCQLLLTAPLGLCPSWRTCASLTLSAMGMLVCGRQRGSVVGSLCLQEVWGNRPIIGFLVFLGLSAWRKATPAAAVASGYLPSSPLPPLTKPSYVAVVGSKISI